MRASVRGADPGRRVAETLAAHDWSIHGASTEALRLLGGSPGGDAPGRLAAVALGIHAEPMLEGARAVFGDALDPVVAAPSAPAPSLSTWVHLESGALAAGAGIDALTRDLGASDRLLLLLSEGVSAAAACPLPGLSRSDFESALRAVSGCPEPLRRGVRERLDGLHGGGLGAAASPAEVLAVSLIDPGGDDDGSLTPIVYRPHAGPSLERDLREEGVWEELSHGVRDRLADAGVGGDPPEDRVRVGVVRAGPPDAAVETALAEARRLGLDTVLLGTGRTGEPEAVGRGMGRVARAVADGLALTRPGCALAEMRLEGGEERHQRLARSAHAASGDLPGVRLASWTPLPGGTDLVAVVAAAPDATAPGPT
ncbi:MAG: DUF4147 domain-containing protein [Gemmatimonadetes bacterium]|nr:DUF4147 domain-containing protein [Gemmatimonadota bacterium]